MDFLIIHQVTSGAVNPHGYYTIGDLTRWLNALVRGVHEVNLGAL